MGRFIIALAAFALAAFTDAAGGVEDPRAFVAATYAAYEREANAPPAEPTHVYSERLRDLFEAYETWARSHDDLVGSLDFDWWANAQDWTISNVSIVEHSFGADRRVIEAHWTNYDRRDSSRFFFVRQDGRWFLDDVVNGGGGDDGWTLSALLRERPE